MPVYQKGDIVRLESQHHSLAQYRDRDLIVVSVRCVQRPHCIPCQFELYTVRDGCHIIPVEVHYFEIRLAKHL